MGCFSPRLLAMHRIQEAMESLEAAAEALEDDVHVLRPLTEWHRRAIEKLMAQRTRLADLAREIDAGPPSQELI